MTAQRGFQCPACGADFDVQERLGDEEEEQEKHGHAEGESKLSPPKSPPPKITCPACGSEFEVDDTLDAAGA